MLRRKFLKLLGGAALVPAIPRTTSAPTSKPYVHSCDPGDLECGFGLAPVKAEGTTVALDPMPVSELSEASLEEMIIDIVEAGERLGIKPTLIQRGVDDERLG